MVYQVGSPAIFDGNRFLPLTGTPIPKMLFSSTLLADCEPDPFTVATLMLKSLITRARVFVPLCNSLRATSPVAMGRDSLPKNSSLVAGSIVCAVDLLAVHPGPFQASR